MTPKIGVALGGGVGRSFAHLGVLAALERAGVYPDFVAGTSGGALVGALYCAGLSVGEMLDRGEHLNWLQMARLAWPWHGGFLTFEPLERWLVSTIGDLTFAGLKHPLAVMATDIELGERVELTSGRVALAVRASCSVPGFITPVRLGGRLLVDGGITDNVPADVLRSMGAKYVIASDVFAPHLRRGWGPLGFGLAAVETMVRNAGGGLLSADYAIKSEMAGVSYLQLGKHDELIAKGERAAEAALPAIRAALGRSPLPRDGARGPAELGN